MITDLLHLSKTILRPASLLLLGLLAIASAHAAGATPQSFDLPADTAEKSIKRFSEQTGLEVFYPSSVVTDVRTNPVKGVMPSRTALDRMLAGTGLTVVQDATGAFSVKRTGDTAGSNSTSRKNDATSDGGDGKSAVASTQSAAAPTANGRGTISGRILNESNGQYLLGASVSVAGTNLATVSEPGGYYVLRGVAAGEARVVVTFLGLDPAEEVVQVGTGRAANRDFNLSRKDEKGEIVTLKPYEVVSEREGNFKAIQQQKSALEIKSVVSADAFGDVSEGNVGEFLKLMPGVMLDYVDADVRSVSIGGLDPKYALIMMDGAPVASASSSSINVGRAFEFEQLSIFSIETVELSKTPTPDVSGSALAGVVNLRSKGAFDRRGRQIRWSTGIEMNSNQLTFRRTPGPSDRETYKIYPNFSLEFSDVFLGDKLGVLAGVSSTRTMVEQNITTYDYAFDANRDNNATEVPRLTYLQMTDAPKVTTRTNYNLRFDYKFSSNLSAWSRVDFNTYEAKNFRRDLVVFFNTPVITNDPAIEYSLNSQTATATTVFPTAGFSFNKSGSTITFSSGASYKRGAFRVDVQGQFSRALSTTEDVPYGYLTSITPTLNNVGLRWSRNGSRDGGISLTQISGPDWKDPASYPVTPTIAVRLLPQNGKEDRMTAKADFRYDWQRGSIPVLFKWGGDFGQQIRKIKSGGTFNVTYRGPDGVPNSVDDRWSPEPYRLRNLAGGNLQDVPIPDRYALAKTFGAHPEWFVLPTEAQLLQRQISTKYKIKEQVDSFYQQTILKLSKKFTLAPGVRFERTRGIGIGPIDVGDRRAKTILTGNPLAAIPTTTVEYTQARYGQLIVNNLDYPTWLKYLHATYRQSDSLVFRASFNNSITRPDMNNLAGGVTLNESVTPPTARIPNPNLKPESGRNLFASAEYYFPKGAGFFTVSGSRRDIANLIRATTVDLPVGENFPNDDGLELGGYRVTSSDNIGRAHLSSLEFSYRQNLVFLPGAWKALSVFGNYTRLSFDNYENFRRPHHLGTGGLSFDRRGLSLRWNAAWAPTYRRAAVNATTGFAGGLGTRLTHDAQLSYRFSKLGSFYLNGRNVFNRKQETYYIGGPRLIMTSFNDYGTVWTGGVRGQF